MIRFAAALCAVGAAVGAAAASGPPPSQAKADGCGRAAPWVYVGEASAASVPSPRWVGGLVRAHPSSDDLVLDLPGGDLASNAAGRLEVRRESVPFFAWPEQGAWVSALGSWVWNCATRATELHPFRALWVQRPFSARSPAGESEADLYITPDATAAGLSAECAHTAKADAATFAACISVPRALDVTGDYAFTLPAPPRPRGAGPLRARIVDRGGGPDPKVTVTGNAARVTLHLGAGAVVAKQIFLGWSKIPQAALPEHLRVRLRSLVVRSSAGPWSLYWDVAGVWGAWSGNGSRVVNLYVARRSAWRFSAVASGGLDGVVFDQYATPEAGLGLHHGLPRSPSPRCPVSADPKGCYQLDYIVTRVG